MAEFKVEGNICIMTCAPLLEPYFEVYDMYPDGRLRYIIAERPKYLDEQEARDA